MFVEVVVEISSKNVDKTFTYKIPSNLKEEVQIGCRVSVPFGKKVLEGFVLSISSLKPDYETKEIISVVDEKPVLNSEMIELGKYVSLKTLCSLTSAYQTMLPKALKADIKVNLNKKYKSYLVIEVDKELKNKQKEVYNFIKLNKKVLKKDAEVISLSAVKTLINNGIIKEIREETYRLETKSDKVYQKIVLNEEQKNAVDEIVNYNGFKPFLLHGVTGSGKTEVYMNVIDKVLSDKKTVIVLVPEISLTPQLISVFTSRFNNNVAILHSRLSDGERYDEWRKIESGQVSIVVGARSAIFAPLTNIGLIVIDEEHTSTYHQENNPRYTACDVAIWRGKYHKCPLILGSATPSIESYTRAKLGVYKLIEMKNRVNKTMPSINIVDMKNEFKKGNRIISEILFKKIRERLEKKEQVIVLLNRRGYTTSLVCHSCGEVVKCPNCDIPLVLHKNIDKLKCHYCNYEINVVQNCFKCHSKDLKSFGFGTEKLEETLNNMFSESRIIRMDFDTTSRKGSHESIIKSFENHEYDILIGTQMIAKGLDFKDVTLVGVVNGDASLNVPDFRSAERTFQLLNQVSGRAGRSFKAGEVVIQVYNPDHYSIHYACLNDYQGFYQTEMGIRKKLNYPPFSDIVLVKISDRNLDVCLKEGKRIADYLKNDNVTVLGPATALIPKVNNIYLVQVIIKYKEYLIIKEKIKYINEISKTSKVKIEIEFNPIRL